MSGKQMPLLQALFWAVWFTANTTEGLAASIPIRQTELGYVQGKQATVMNTTALVNVFLGIPFAAPPTGRFRFSPPQPAIPWSGIRDATSFPPMCLQDIDWIKSDITIMKVSYPVFNISEDCLYLNIHAPASAEENSKLPVMVWIPGGAFIIGTGSIYDGSALAAFENVVVVTVQYRLGLAAFFNTGDEYAQGNWGFLDQVAALIWVRKNIAFFGGDPGSVTIFGESAGAMSVSTLILSPMAKGLFHRAIMESGVAIFPYLKATDSERDHDLQVLADLCSCDKKDSATLVKCLREKTESEILSISKKVDFFTRVVDGEFLPQSPLELLNNRNFKAVPSIIGVNNHECGYILVRSQEPNVIEGTSKENATLLMKSVLNIPSEFLTFVADEYFGSTQDTLELRDQLLDMMGDVFFVVPGLKTSQYHRDSGAPVYFYEFQHRPDCFKDTKPAYVKADHVDEIRFVFGGAFLTSEIVMFVNATEEEKQLSRKMMKYWANFARTGDPNGEGLLQWPAYDQNEQYLELNLKVAVGKKLKNKRLEFWTKILPEKMASSAHFHCPFLSLTLSLMLTSSLIVLIQESIFM